MPPAVPPDVVEVEYTLADEVCSYSRMADKQVGALETDEQVDSMSSGVWLEVGSYLRLVSN